MIKLKNLVKELDSQNVELVVGGMSSAENDYGNSAGDPESTVSTSSFSFVSFIFGSWTITTT